VFDKFEKITSISNPKIKFIKSLLLRKNRSNTGLFLAEGERTCREAILHGWIPKYVIFNVDRDKLSNIEDLLEICIKNKGLLLDVSEKILSKITKKDNPQTILAVFEQKKFLLKDIQEEGSLAWLVLERVRDPGNLGTIFRTCNGTGVKTVILVGSCCDPYSPEAVRASMGAIFSVKIINIDMNNFLQWAKNKDNKIVVTSLNSNKVYTECNWGKNPILIMGNEQSGVSELIENSAKEILKLPMLGSSDSLNLSVSTGIFLYEVLRKSY
jgi:TrmH family RNA methyltransferase